MSIIVSIRLWFRKSAKRGRSVLELIYVQGVEIKRRNLDEVILNAKSAAATKGEMISPQQMLGIKSQLLNRLIQIQLLLQKAVDDDKAAGKSKADLQLAPLLERADSQAAFARQFEAVGMTPDELRAKVTQETTAMATLTRELGITAANDEVVQQEAQKLEPAYLDNLKKVADIEILDADLKAASAVPAVVTH